MALGSIQSPSENEYQKYFLGVKAAGAWGWQPHHLHVPNVMKIWKSKPSETLWPTPGLLRDSAFTFYSSLSLLFFKSLDKDDRHFWQLSSHQRPLQITYQSDASSGDQKDGNRCAPHRHLLARCGREIMDHFALETRSCTQWFSLFWTS
jgi:hypothetical protein